jgi:hypothetical protein
MVTIRPKQFAWQDASLREWQVANAGIIAAQNTADQKRKRMVQFRAGRIPTL